MNWLYDHIISLTLLIINVLYTTFYPMFRQWLKDRKRNFRRHLVFEEFKTAQNHLDALGYFRKNELREANIRAWVMESNAYIMNFCVFVIDRRTWQKSQADFDFSVREAVNRELDKFRLYTLHRFEDIVRHKFAENTLHKQSRLVLDIFGYTAERGLTNRQKVWFILNDIRKYVMTQKEMIDILNSLNGDLDAYEQNILQKNNPNFGSGS